MSFLKKFTQGGQVTLHNIRMMKQVLSITFSATLILTVLFLVIKTWIDHTPYQWQVLGMYGIAWLKTSIPLGKIQDRTQIFTFEDGQAQTVRCVDLLESPWIQSQVDMIYTSLLHNIFWSLGVFILLMLATMFFWTWRGKVKKEREILSGTSLVTATELTKLIQRNGEASDFTLAGVPLIQNKELQHMLVLGTTGAGKTNCIHELLQQIRAKGQRAIVVDLTGAFIEKYYRPGIDKILNPLDARSEPWNIWSECTQPYHFDALSAFLIPQQTKDTFWSNASRTILSVAAQTLRASGSTSMKELLDYTLFKPLPDIQEFFSGTKAASLVDVRSRETVSSIRSTLSVSIQCLELLEEVDAQQTPFSIRNWVTQDTGEEWLFLSAPPEMRETLKPLMSLWSCVGINSLMSLPTSADRRLWYIIDELPALQRLPELSTILAEGRKYGGCVVLGTQDMSLLDEVYGYNLVRSITNLCSTKVIFRIAGSDIADRVSRWLGSQEISESVEHISYGAHQMRDGVSLNDHRREKVAVNADTLMKLPDLQGFLKLPGDYPIAKVTFQYHDLAIMAEGIIRKK